jgi:phenylalanyl-tRNA synthetase alpha chain
MRRPSEPTKERRAECRPVNYTAPMDPVSAAHEALARFGDDYANTFAAATTAQALRDAKATLLGKKGTLTDILKVMGKLPPDDRKAIGERVNELKAQVEAAFEARLLAIAKQARDEDLAALPFDLSLPGRLGTPRGHLHPITQTIDDLLGIFKDLGFLVLDGPQVELEETNFTKLAFPPDHPAMDMQDTFWVKVEGNDARTLLRTHTSPVQVRAMTSREPPMAIVSAGPVFRRDDDVTHSPMFHQIEGFLVDEKVSFAELKGVLTAFIERLYGKETKTRWRPSYFPFVEPGAEVDATCVFCAAKGCRVCKGTGWVEVLGCGMIHPEVFDRCGIDSEKYTGFAFGLGIERLAMLRYGIQDIRMLFENDPRFLAQF